MPISIIVPVYNNPDDVTECIAAIRKSAPRDAEILVVDDGSTDSTPAVAAAAGARVLNLAENSGPAAARNYGARHAYGDILVFVDADVVLAPDALQKITESFAARADIAAVFGSYDATPRAPGLLSQYRNLLHHFVHQQGHAEAATFWAGCGAIRKSVFEQVGGFDEKRFARPSIEDIELGYRLRAAGFRIILDKSIQGTHLKRWRFGSMLRTDILQRAIPWSRLILETKHLPDDLNLKSSQRASCFLAIIACAALVFAVWQPAVLFVSVAALTLLVIINRDLYLFFGQHGGVLFTGACVLLHFLYYLYSGISYLLVWVIMRLGIRTRSCLPFRSPSRESH